MQGRRRSRRAGCCACSNWRKASDSDASLSARNDLLAWARAIDTREAAPRATRPAPAPPVALRPRRLSVTEIEKWLRDPYAIYARHVLRLKPLDPLDPEPGPRERGIAIHGALEHFLRAHPDALPDDALAALAASERRGVCRGGCITGSAGAVAAAVRARGALVRVVSDDAAKGDRPLDRRDERDAGVARPSRAVHADRTRRPDRSLRRRTAAIIDYKTGRVPTDKQIDAAARAAIAARSRDADGGRLRRYRALRACASSSISSSPAAIRRAKRSSAKPTPRRRPLEAQARLIGLIAAYDDERRGYRSREMPERVTDKGDYDHLARVAEWSRVADDE